MDQSNRREPMKPAVALAMLQRDNRWLLQLRDDLSTILYPGHWGLFGGHLEPGETPDQAVQRELEEEIAWRPGERIRPWFSDARGSRVVHVFRGELVHPLEKLQLLEGQDWTLASLEQLRSGSIWSERRQEKRPIAPGLIVVVQRLLTEADPHAI